MSQAGAQKNYRWQASFVVAFVSLLSWLVVSQAAGLDRETFERLVEVFGSHPIGREQAGAEPALLLKGFFQLVPILVFAAAATWSGFRLSVVPRLLVLVQLFVLTLLSVVGFWQLFKVPGHPLGYFTAVFVGTLGGYSLRRLELQRRKQESQFYELFLRNKELQETKLQLVKQDEIERRMLAADLHDQVLNDLKAVRHKLDSYLVTPDAAVADSIKSLLNQAMDEIREVMDSLCPSALEHLGLVAALEDCLRRGSERGGFKVRFKSKLQNEALDVLTMVEKSLLYRLVQESVTNICKHAGASIVRAAVDMDGEHVSIKVTDNGRGIDPAKLREDSRGVRYMRQRADLIGATIAWRSGEDGKGTTVEIRISLAGRKDAEGSSSRGRISAASARNAPDSGENSRST
jgi:signal transduction histidine kinase